MRGKAAASFLALWIAAGAAAASSPQHPAGAAGSTSQPSATRITVKPGAGSPTTRFAVSFRAPDRTGRVAGGVQRRYIVSASGPSLNGCVSSASKEPAPAKQGAHIKVMLDPRHRAWCAGTYHGRVDEIITPGCPYRAACAFMVALHNIGKFTFRVRSAGG
jgi:hypothetical protein